MNISKCLLALIALENFPYNSNLLDFITFSNDKLPKLGKEMKDKDGEKLFRSEDEREREIF